MTRFPMPPAFTIPGFPDLWSLTHFAGVLAEVPVASLHVRDSTYTESLDEDYAQLTPWSNNSGGTLDTQGWGGATADAVGDRLIVPQTGIYLVTFHLGFQVDVSSMTSGSLDIPVFLGPNATTVYEGLKTVTTISDNMTDAGTTDYWVALQMTAMTLLISNSVITPWARTIGGSSGVDLELGYASLCARRLP